MLQSENKYNPVSTLASRVLSLYEEALRDVRFPDVDLALLVASRDALSAAQREVEALEAALSAARDVVRAKGAALDAATDRALAYARVFAEGNETLTARLRDLGRPLVPSDAAVEARPPRRRGRPPKSAKGEGDALFALEPPRGEELVGLDRAPSVGERADAAE